MRHTSLENLSAVIYVPLSYWYSIIGPIKSIVCCSNLDAGMSKGVKKPEEAIVRPLLW